MTSSQAKRLCELLGANPDTPIDNEPRYIAVQRVFDAEAADEAIADHNERAKAPPPAPKETGKPATKLIPMKGGAK